MVEGSYGFIRIGRKYVSDDSFDQEIVVKNIPNPDSVVWDPDCKEADWSDAEYCFVLDPMPKDEFKRRFPKAEIRDFTGEEARVAPDWIHERTVLVAEYWRVEIDEARLYLLPNGEVTDDLKPHRNAIRSRVVEKKTVVQYITNGIEILERTEQPGQLIPIIPFIGLERWIDDGSGPKRKLFSLVRLARDPQMSLAYLCSLEMEEAGLTPKVPYIGYKGQFESDAETWETVTKVPHAYAQVDPMVDGATGQVLPLRQRQQFTPNFQSYEIAKDACQRAIQAAMGISPLPTAAQRANEKSGVAIERIQSQQNLGAFHFSDNFDRALMYAGRVIESWIPATYDTERDIAIRHPDDSHQIVRINTPEPYLDPKTNQAQHFTTEEGDHDIAVSTGPSYESQREEAADFLNTLIQNLKGLPVPPPQASELLSLAIRMRQLGPLGEQMADIVSPKQQGQVPPEAQAAIAQAQQQNQALYAYIQKLQQELQKLQLEKQAKVLDNQARMNIARMQIEAGITEAEIEAKSQQQSERNEFVGDMWQQLHSQAHETALQVDQQQHEQALAQQQQNAQAQQASDRQFQAQQAEQQQDRDQE
jgi:hypothetical protein